MKTKLDQWVSDCWLAGYSARDLERTLLKEGRSNELIDAAVDLHNGLCEWESKSLASLAASAADWKEM